MGMDPGSPIAAHRATPVELIAQLEAASDDTPFLIYRDGADIQRIVHLRGVLERVTIGRRPANDVPLEWDIQVSRTHAQLERLGDEWAVSDDGLSSNGTFVNGVRIRGRRRLRDQDELKVGTTVIAFRAPAGGASMMTFVPEQLQRAPRLGAKPASSSSGAGPTL
jgi:pSer/pThr/pTyr-binding forkhead associated (FHA) protein